MDIKPRKLRNGTTEAEQSVKSTMMRLEQLYDRDPVAVWELREKCRNPRHQFFPAAGETLLRHGLLLPDLLQPHSAVKNIVESAVAGDLVDMHLQSPYADEDDDKSRRSTRKHK